MRPFAWLLLLCLPGPQDVKKLEERLAKEPDDPVANLAMGKLLAFEKGEWEKGISNLARGSDKPLAELAQKEIAGAEDVPAKISLADEWLKVSSKHPKNRQAIQDHATSWYAQAWKAMEEGPEKNKLLAKARKMSTPPMGPSVAKGNVNGWRDFSLKEAGSSLDGTYAHSGRFSASISSSVKSPRGNFPRIHTQEILIPVGAKVVVLSAWVRSEGTDPHRDGIQAGFFSMEGGLGQGGPEFPADLPFWTKIEKAVQVIDGSSKVAVWVILDSQKGTLWVDDVDLRIDGKSIISNGSMEK